MTTKQFQLLLNKLTHLDEETRLLALNTFAAASTQEKNQLVAFFSGQNQKLDSLYQKFGNKIKKIAFRNIHTAGRRSAQLNTSVPVSR